MSAHEENEKGENVNCLANKYTLAGLLIVYGFLVFWVEE
jgi:hypothetical protein